MKQTLFLLLVTSTILHAKDYTFDSRSSSLVDSVFGYDNVKADNLSSGFAGFIGTIKVNLRDMPHLL